MEEEDFINKALRIIYEKDIVKALDRLNKEDHYLRHRSFFSVVKSKCECGSEIAGAPGHSDWCPKYKKESKESL